MKVAFITRSSLFSSSGGDTLQVLNTAKYLEELNVAVDIKLTHEKITYDEYDLLHFFSIIRPADILPHIQKSKTPFVVTPLLIDYSEFDKQYRKGITGKIFRFFSPDQIEYLKTMARWTRRQQRLKSYVYLLKGQRNSIQIVLKKAALILPNSELEYGQLTRTYAIAPPYNIILNGIEPRLFHNASTVEKDKCMVVCVARIEGLKNQINLIKALNNSEYQLYLIGNPATNQATYYDECRSLAAKNIHFIHHIRQEELIPYYQKAKVHILPSWFETCGLSSLEAAAMGCNVVITNKGYASEYFKHHAFYCEPSSPGSIKEAIFNASNGTVCTKFQQKIIADFTWQNTAVNTYKAYKKIVPV
ncbi:MAG: glycosyltransferase family 4 protein [Ginsengibacter sp.]